jgi:hypothetical protein
MIEVGAEGGQILGVEVIPLVGEKPFSELRE